MSAINTMSIIDHFPHQTLTQIDTPSYGTIKTIHIQLNANARSIESPHSAFGHLGLTLSDSAYSTINGDNTYTIPTEPDPPVIPTSATGVQISKLDQTYNIAFTRYLRHVSTDQALKALLLKATPDIYTRELRYSLTGYATVTTIQSIEHLYLNYGLITQQALKINDLTFRQPFIEDEKLEDLYLCMDNCRDFADAGKNPYTDAQLINVLSMPFSILDAFPMHAKSGTTQ